MTEPPEPDPLAKLVGERVRQIRKKRGLGQDDLAAAIGVTTGAVSLYERARRPINLATLAALATALHTTPAELVAEPPEPECECFGGSGIYASTHARAGRLRCDLCGRPVKQDAIDSLVAINRRGGAMT